MRRGRSPSSAPHLLADCTLTVGRWPETDELLLVIGHERAALLSADLGLTRWAVGAADLVIPRISTAEAVVTATGRLTLLLSGAPPLEVGLPPGEADAWRSAGYCLLGLSPTAEPSAGINGFLAELLAEQAAIAEISVRLPPG